MAEGAPHILLVEDDDGIRDTVAECLVSEGYRVTSLANGAQALEWLAAEPIPDLIVLDLVMPVMNGADLIERLRATPRLASIPVVLMTAAMPGAGMPVPLAVALLPKPFDLDALLEAVARHHRRRA